MLCNVCMYACMHVYIYICMYVCMYVCVYVCVCVCMCVCMYVCMYACIANQRVLLVLTSPEITFVARSATAQLAPQPCFARLQWNKSHSSPWAKIDRSKRSELNAAHSSPTNRRGQTTRHFTSGVGFTFAPLPSVATPSVRIIIGPRTKMVTAGPRLCVFDRNSFLALRLWPRESSCLVSGFSSSFLGLLCTNLSHRNRSLTHWFQPASELVRQLASFVAPPASLARGCP